MPAGATDYDVFATEGEDKRPPSPTGQGLCAHQVAELVQMLAATKVENDRLRAAAVPRLNRQQLERLIAESLPYQWMQTLAVALKAYLAMDANWDAHKPAKAIWTVVHEELRNKRQGRTSHMPTPQNAGATAPATSGTPLGRVVRAPGGQAVVGGPQAGVQCYSCGQLGDWARQCPQAAVTGTLHQPYVQAKISQAGDQTILTSNKGWTFDMNGPPPANCRRCGQPHWEMVPCGAQSRVSLLPTATADAGAPVGAAAAEGTDDAVHDPRHAPHKGDEPRHPAMTWSLWGPQARGTRGHHCRDGMGSTRQGYARQNEGVGDRGHRHGHQGSGGQLL